MTAGVYGKIAGQPDFLRVNAGAFSQAGLDLWFQEGAESLRSAGVNFPASATAFLLRPSKSRQSAFVGAFAQSMDAAGRSFPLVVFRQLAPSDLTQPFPALLDAQEEFVRGAGLIATEGRTLVAADLTARVEALDASSPASGSVRGSAAQIQDDSAQPLLAALGGGGAAAVAYAMRTFAAACDQAAKAPTRRAASDGSEVSTVVTVDAPAPTPAVRRLWLEMAQQRLGGQEDSPSFIWTDDPSGRLLLALGPPPPAMLTYLANPRHRASRLWPLHTTVAVALEQALKSLTPQQHQVIAKPQLSLRELGATFT